MNPTSAETGYSLVKLHASKQLHRVLTADQVEEERSTGISWDWRVEGPRLFQVFLGFEMKGPQEAPEEIEVDLVGTFQIEGEDTSLALQPFVQFSAPAIILPYIRQIVTNLTSHGPFEPLLMSPMNVQKMMEFANFEESTGFHQLREDPELAAAFGVTHEEIETAGDHPGATDES